MGTQGGAPPARAAAMLVIGILLCALTAFRNLWPGTAAGAPAATGAPRQHAANQWVASALDELARGRLDAAADRLRLAGWSDATDPEAALLLGWVLMAQEDWEGAGRAFAAATTHPTGGGAAGPAEGAAQLVARYGLGQAAAMRARPAEAAKGHLAALDVAPGAALPHVALARLAWAAARSPDAAQALKPVWPAPVPDSSAAWLAQAELHLRNALQTAPDRVDTYIDLASLLMEMRRWQQAEAVLREGIRLDHQRAVTHFLLGQVYEELRQWPNAIRSYRRALTLDPELGAARQRLEQLERMAPSR